MLFRYLLLLLLCVSPLARSQAQTYTTKKTADGKVKSLYDKAVELSNDNQEEKAIGKLDEAVAIDPTFIDAWLKKAELQYDKGDFTAAIGAYQKAMAIDSMYSPRSLFFLAKSAWNIDSFEIAARYFETYLAHPKANAEELKAKARVFLANSRFAAVAVKNPVPFDPHSIGSGVNTDQFEYLPSITADESILVYTARVGGREDFYMSRKVGGVWQHGEPINEINTNENEGAQSISADGKTLVFTGCARPDGLGSCDLYISEWRNNGWTKPVNIGAPVNSNAWESQPALSADGNALYFASNRAGTKGGSDIWVCNRQPDGRWGAPVNLGDTINTTADESTPFLHPDGQTLYFASMGHPGMGDADLFYARKKTDNTWGTPVNMGYPINTKAHEGALVVSLDGKTAYFATDRSIDKGNLAESLNQTDIFSFDLYPAARPLPVTYVKAVVVDAGTRMPLAGAKLELTDLSSGKTYMTSVTTEDGAFLACLPLGKDYAMNVAKKGYLFYSENFNLTEVNSLEKPFTMQIELRPVPVESTAGSTAAPSKAIILKNVFFASGSAVLKRESATELNKLQQLLTENPALKIQLNGHTDNVGADADNLVLSQNRAKAVYDYLVTNGIAPERLSYQGFGETQPIASNDTEAGRQENRRTEFVVVK